ncbi:alpha/beta fold hydrolase [Marinimicrobium sp. ABcell2]|uniref:alpha/beta fold hydrolase n=1 Tax=Marinimicrobium sp. ABcell2 TaxID=3069751 RepID=UPI0027B11893|nr:alpha/beta hydrolase [Marinimicrobium sp. ABcell2]MDQ2077135.1 alpha/beta hydrolase [Marinimicrobium sp. ABcell2]
MNSAAPIANVAAQLHSKVVGEEGELILFLHGWSCQGSDWDAVLAALGDERHMMVLDLPGHGKSADVDWADWTIVGLARLVVAAAQRAGADRLTLVGHSMGGTVALEAARLWAQNGGQLGGVVLVDTFGLPYGDMDAETIASIETPFQQDFVGAMHYLVDNTTVPELDEATRDWIKQRMASADPEKMLPIWADLLRWSPDAAFAELHCPIHAINGEHISEPARNRCAGNVMEQVIPGSHHFPQFEQPKDFTRTLRSLLA